mmetsp:Transcript_98097/g.245850  ORF Transcript_98097/g.245850 Transcript_98097/m.245850 type:complete len:248 (-) Transcript_98097:4-747(-)
MPFFFPSLLCFFEWCLLRLCSAFSCRSSFGPEQRRLGSKLMWPVPLWLITCSKLRLGRAPPAGERRIQCFPPSASTAASCKDHGESNKSGHRAFNTGCLSASARAAAWRGQAFPYWRPSRAMKYCAAGPRASGAGGGRSLLRAADGACQSWALPLSFGRSRGTAPPVGHMKAAVAIAANTKEPARRTLELVPRRQLDPWIAPAPTSLSLMLPSTSAQVSSSFFVPVISLDHQARSATSNLAWDLKTA